MPALRTSLLAVLGTAFGLLLWLSTGDRPLAEANRMARAILADTAHEAGPAPLPLLVQALVAGEDPDYFEGPAWRSPMLGQMARMRLAEQTPQREHRAPAFQLTTALITLRLDLALTDAEILRRYLDRVYFGRNCHGAATASLGLFATSLDDATDAQLLALASLPRSPTMLSRNGTKRRATQRPGGRAHRADDSDRGHRPRGGTPAGHPAPGRDRARRRMFPRPRRARCPSSHKSPAHRGSRPPARPRQSLGSAAARPAHPARPVW